MVYQKRMAELAQFLAIPSPQTDFWGIRLPPQNSPHEGKTILGERLQIISHLSRQSLRMPLNKGILENSSLP